MNRLARLLREPLLRFLIAGAALFVLFTWVAPSGAGYSDDVIVVDRESLLVHLQYRTRAFEPRVAEERLAALSESELQTLIDEYVREEALHREALALGMDGNDYVIKRRLIQKVEFLAQGLADAGIQLDDAALESFLEENAADYRIDPTVTFTHVFLDAERRGPETAREEAARMRETLNASRVPFVEATRHGDRFPYHVNYVERTPDFVASHFGAEMARALFEIDSDGETWHGPYRSPYGFHVILVARSEPGRMPRLDEIRDRVSEDAERAAVRELQAAALDQIVAGYDVRRTYTPEQTRKTAASR